ncbi:MAG: precorrin-4 C(11)-methyltransferase [Lachnospirales bacterium]
MVYFVGAGSGAVDLITVRGARLLSEADVVIYAGSLVNKELLSYCKNAEIYNSAYMNLDEVAKVYSDNRHKKIVRLHTGDPCIYGAIKEQMDILSKMGIEYEYCPGVSSFCGAASALKCEYTLPNVSQSVIITRAEGRTKMPEKESIKSFASHNATMVIFLSASLTEKLQEDLIEGGYNKDTPCAIVYKATWEDEKVIRGTLSNLHNMAKENNITKTALVVCGWVLDSDYELSKLYDKNFKTEFRK